MTRRDIALLSGLALVGAGQYVLLKHFYEVAVALTLLAIGILCVGLVAWRDHLPLPRSQVPDPSGGKAPTRAAHGLPHHGLALIAAACFLAVALGWLTTSDQGVRRYDLYFALWATSCALLVAATLTTDEIRGRLAQLRQRLAEGWRLLAALGLVTLVAFLARVVGLEQVPQSFTSDEATFALQAASIVDGTQQYNPFAPGWLSHPYLYAFLVAPWVTILGRTVAAARMASAIAGTLTIPAVYLLGRELFGRRVGLVAAIFLAGFSVHVHFSRLALNNAVDPLLAAAAFYFALCGIRSKRLSDYALAGVFLGLSQYFYTGARLLPFLMIALLALVLVLRPESLGSSRQRRALRVALAVLGFLIATWPWLWHFLVSGEPVSVRFAQLGLVQTGALNLMSELMGPYLTIRGQLLNAWLGLIHTRDTGVFYGQIETFMGYGGGVPLLVGAAYSAVLGLRRRANRPEAALPLLWVAGVVTGGGTLLIVPPSYQRYVELVPAVAVLVGLGVVGTIDLIAAADIERRGKLEKAAPFALALLLMAAGLRFYFGVHASSHYGYARDRASEALQGQAALARSEFKARPQQNLYCLNHLTRFSESPLLYYFEPEIVVSDINDPVRDVPHGVDPSGNNLFLVPKERVADLGLLAQYVPGGEVERYKHWTGDTLFYTYRTSAEPD